MRRIDKLTLQEEILDLIHNHKGAAEWSAADIAEHLDYDHFTVKVNQAYRELLADRLGLPMPEPELRALHALAALGGIATADEIAKRLDKSTDLVRRRLRALREGGFTTSRNGDPKNAGHCITKTGMAMVKKTAPPKKKKRT